MNKRIICIILAMLLLIPFVLTSCSQELTDDEIIDKIINSGSTALTLSIWVPTEANVDDQNFKDRVDAVEDAINAILRDKNYSTMIEIHAISKDKYVEELNKKLDSAEQSVSKDFGGVLPSAYSQGYVNKAKKVPIGNSYMYELDYPAIISSQLDIFYIGGYSNYLSYVNSGDAIKLNDYINSGNKYGDINKMISPKILEQLSIGGGKYAIPNNHLYTKDTTYQYVLIDTELLNAYKEQNNLDESFKLDSILDCEDFINFVGENYEDVIPFVGSIDDAPGISVFELLGMVERDRRVYHQSQHTDEGFRVLIESGTWKVGMLRYSQRFARLGELERHLLTDEVFVLLSGSATLYTDCQSLAMEQNSLYTIPAGVWHHIILSEDACVIVVENQDTSRENTEKRYFEEQEEPYYAYQ